VRREDVGGHHLLAGFVEREWCRFENGADALQRQESTVPFVHVEDRGRNAQRFERANAADAQHDFLLDAQIGAGAVKFGGDFAVGRGVFHQVGIEQIQRHAPDIGAPHFAENRVVREIDAHVNGRAIRVSHRLNREIVKIQLGIRFLLPAIG
jgi:hypothetical protein